MRKPRTSLVRQIHHYGCFQKWNCCFQSGREWLANETQSDRQEKTKNIFRCGNCNWQKINRNLFWRCLHYVSKHICQRKRQVALWLDSYEKVSLLVLQHAPFEGMVYILATYFCYLMMEPTHGTWTVYYWFVSIPPLSLFHASFLCELFTTLGFLVFPLQGSKTIRPMPKPVELKFHLDQHVHQAVETAKVNYQKLVRRK